jgi:hypothetical protein
MSFDVIFKLIRTFFLDQKVDTQRKKKRAGTTTLREETTSRRQEAEEDYEHSEDLKDEKEKKIILSWREDPGVLWLSEQSMYWFANDFLTYSKISGKKGWVESIPNIDEMPPGWPGKVSLDGLSVVHLSPDCEPLQLSFRV